MLKLQEVYLSKRTAGLDVLLIVLLDLALHDGLAIDPAVVVDALGFHEDTTDEVVLSTTTGILREGLNVIFRVFGDQ